MLQYDKDVIILFVEKVWDKGGLSEQQSALVIMDNFKGQVQNRDSVFSSGWKQLLGTW